VCSSIFDAHSSRFAGSATHRHSTPRSGQRTLNSWNVPPYTRHDETKLIGCFRFCGSWHNSASVAIMIAPIPEDVDVHDASPANPYASSSASVPSR
jgi:hypothetical protein